MNGSSKTDVATLAFGGGRIERVYEFQSKLFSDGRNLLRLQLVGLPIGSDAFSEVLHLLVRRKRLHFQDEKALICKLIVNLQQKHAHAGVSPVEVYPFDHTQANADMSVMCSYTPERVNESENVP